MSSSNQRYSRDEIQAIFRQAAERQESAQDGDSDGEGLTLDELRQIGAESGLDPSHIEAAARSLASRRSPEAHTRKPSGLERLYGVSASAHLERVVPGTVDEATWRDMVATMESVFQNAGDTSQAGALREWHLSSSLGFDKRIFQSSSPSDWVKIFDSGHQPSNGPVTVELRPEGNDTRVSMSYEMPTHRLWEAPGLAGFFLAGTLLLGGIFAFVGEPILLLPMALMLACGIAFGIYFRSSHRKEIEQTRTRMAKALDRLEHIQEAQHRESSEEQQQTATDRQTATDATEQSLDSPADRASDADVSSRSAPRTRS
jgi:hypothetical protein